MLITKLDNSITLFLNRWGIEHSIIVKYASEYSVFVVIMLGLIWTAANTLKVLTPTNFNSYVKRAIHDAVFLLLIPVGVTTGVSEIISSIYVRQRPFVGLPSITLLSPHSADGGMPSHHVVFMISIATCIFFYQRALGMAVGILTVISGLARIASGFHYPTDVIVGLAIGIVSVITTRKFLIAIRPRSAAIS